MENYKFLYKRNELAPYIKDVQAYADKERDAFGFLAKDVYEGAAYNEKIIVAISNSDDEYAGHLMFGGVCPNGRIFQTLVKEDHKHTGLAQAMILKLVILLEERGFTSITAKVATDLISANKFYAGLGFETASVTDGGKSKGRKINHRLKQLKNPTLFTWQDDLAPVSELMLPVNMSNRSPLYLIDLNVMFDAVRKRSRTKEAQDLISAVSQNLIRVAISEEFIKELERTAYNPHHDPILELAKGFNTYANPDQTYIKSISKLLSPIIFPDRHRDKKLNNRDKSDLIHLATAIKNRAEGFVTSEKAILAAADHLRSQYNLDVISPYEISLLVQDGKYIYEKPIVTDEMSCVVSHDMASPEIQKAQNNLNIHNDRLPCSGNEDTQHLTILSKDNLALAYAWWTCNKGPRPKNQAYIYVDDHAQNAGLLVDFICDKIMRECSIKNISLIRLQGNTDSNLVFQSFYQNGFRAITSSSTKDVVFQKIALGKAVHPRNWQKVRLEIQQITDGIKLPEKMPIIENPQDCISITNRDNSHSLLTLNDFERLFYPTLYLAQNIQGVILPIRRTYSEELINTHDQYSLLSSKEAILRQERVYFSNSSTRNVLRSGRIVFFYESGKEKGGRKAIIAAARIRQSNVMFVDDMENDLLRRGVIDRRTLQKISPKGKMTVTFFENILPFKKNISYKRLNEIGCNDGSNFVTAKKISANHVLTIIEEGL